MKSIWRSINWIKALKIAGGAVAAILLAEALGLHNAVSAGIITLLTVQNTRRETIFSSVRRVAAFGIMTLLSVPIYMFCGTEPWSFGVVLLLLLLICYGLRMEDSVPINAVMATHYMAAGGVTLGMVGNEALLLCIGSGIGICLNWFMPQNLRKIRQKQKELDMEIRGILRRMSRRLLETDHTGYDAGCFERTNRLSVELHREAELFLQNQTWRSDLYFIRYVTMRREQCTILQEIYSQILKLTIVPEQAKPLSGFLEAIASQYHECNDCSELLKQLEELKTTYRSDVLPQNREEFENRAILYCILIELRSFLEIKQRFFHSLPEQERRQLFLE